MTDRNILIFCEPRSGSTWFVTRLANLLQRKTKQVDLDFDTYPDSGWTYTKWDEVVRGTNFNDASFLYHTHYPRLIEATLRGMNDPVLLRTTRRDVCEQFLSYHFMGYADRSKVNTHVIRNGAGPIEKQNAAILALAEQAKLAPRQLQAESFLRVKGQWQETWERLSAEYDSAEIAYEDLFEGVDIPLLGISGLGFADDGYLAKLPQYKQTAYENYAEIKGWFN